MTKREAFPDAEDLTNALTYPGPVEEGFVYAGAIRGTDRHEFASTRRVKDPRNVPGKSRTDPVSTVYFFGLLIGFIFLLLAIFNMI